MSTHATKIGALHDARSNTDRPQGSSSDKVASHDILNQVTASYIDTALAMRQAHWNIRGQPSASWHEILVTLHKALESHVDDIAGRSVALGGVPPGTVQIIANRTSMAPFPANVSDDADLVEALIVRFGQLATLSRRAIAEFERLQDPVTVHHLTEAVATVEKQLWIIESHSRSN